MKHLVLALLLVLLCSQVYGTYDILKGNTKDQILFKHRPLIHEEGLPEDHHTNANLHQTYVLHFDHQTVVNQKEKLFNVMSTLNIKIGNYLPHNSWIATATRTQIKKLKSSLGKNLKYATRILNHHKSIHENHAEQMVEEITESSQNVYNQASIILDIGHHAAPEELRETYHLVKKHAKASLASLLSQKVTNQLKFHVMNDRQLLCTVFGLNAPTLKRFYHSLLSIGHIHWGHFLDSTKAQSKFASSLIQNFDKPKSQELWKVGLDGANETIGVGDTGLDYYNCEFYDENEQVRILKEMPSQTLSSTRHRKIQAYFAMVDNKDGPGGHGTHVSGLVAGKPNEKHSPTALKGYQSLAHASKIAFYDSGCDTPGGCTCPKSVQCECDIRPGFRCPQKNGVLYMPLDLATSYFPYFEKANANIVSSSWGSGFYRDYTYGYSMKSRAIDEYTWKNPYLLPLFAAGNSGSQFGYESLTTEAESKNALAIGASQNTFESFLPRVGLKTSHKTVIKHLRSGLIQHFCDRLRPSTYNRKRCKAALRFKTQAQCCGDASDERLCVGKRNCCGTQKFGRKLQVGYSCCNRCIHRKLRSGRSRMFGKNNMAFFTSRGPTSDGRLKPDIVTIGHALASSNSRGTDPSRKCDTSSTLKEQLIKKSGTSMATPVAASAAAVVRQFYREGFYARYAKSSLVSGGFIPTSSLIKATLIHSGRRLHGFMQFATLKSTISLSFKRGMSMSLTQNAIQGFGAIDLHRVLGIDANLYLPNGDRDRSIRTGEIHHFCFKMPVKQNFRVTLVWNDYPSTPQAAIHLVNDLDLMVVDPHGEISYGNGKYSSIGRSLTEPDSINNVEQLDFNMDTMKYTRGNYRIIVRGHHVPHGPQPYSLVVSSSGAGKRVVRRVSLSHCPTYKNRSNHFVMNRLAHHRKYLIGLGRKMYRSYRICQEDRRYSCDEIRSLLRSISSELNLISTETRHHRD